MEGPHHQSQLAALQLLAALWDKITTTFRKPNIGHMSNSWDVSCHWKSTATKLSQALLYCEAHHLLAQ